MGTYGICKECEKENTGYQWCIECNSKHFQQNFKNWTSNNDDINKLIQETQLLSINHYRVLEWIPYNKFYDIEYIAKGGFGKVYKAKWIDGYIHHWDTNENQNWKRFNSNEFVALKSLNNSENVTLEFINEITMHCKAIEDSYISFIVRVHGITQDPETKNYMMVLQYAEKGSLRNYLNKYYSKLDWKTKLFYLWNIAYGLETIHERELIHRDLHIGNVLKFPYYSSITDMGLCKPADYNSSENSKNRIYGVLPYIAPEILRGQNYTKAADIYSFGIIMYEVISGLFPYYDLSHDENLAIKICQGLRPRFNNIKVPQLIVHLIKRCLDANPLNRPKEREISDILIKWNEYDNNQSEIGKQIKEAEEINNNLPTSNMSSVNLSYEIHSGAVYTSRLLKFNNLPEPKNSDDYYEQNDNIISEKFSETLQIDLSQLKN
ncbi:kinase-like domain-containing protein [Rhizophagus irregularis DAOM 181602=DAOM 197198]|uniref:Ypk2p n=1 Tax=Rhizophagus irregularis (strain DAOM 197198w) TaxID=1432141 RepID=A0A015J7U3_RHIIW|nr:Ypk2p [Rhizophagus irregularis DAOM 197198w]GBC40232.2 kinase-like domain-containing protein [Rhizophagus irregularis DAOM 181602=DAOM 197198]